VREASYFKFQIEKNFESLINIPETSFIWSMSDLQFYHWTLLTPS